MGCTAHLQQLPLHLIDHQVGGLPPLPALQVIHHNRVGHLGGIQRPLQPQFLSRQQLGLAVQLHDLLLQLHPPEVHVLQPLAQRGFGALLGSLRAGGRMFDQLLGLGAAALRPLARRHRLVADPRVAAVPLGQLVFGGAEAGHGHAAAGARPLAAGHIADLAGQRAGGNHRRLRLVGLRHGGATVLPSPRRPTPRRLDGQPRAPIGERICPKGRR
uniref:Tektin n=1 Tax=Taeniopygia guttata TaxID=59729 RepID=A0A674GBC4_TAEGU